MQRCVLFCLILSVQSVAASIAAAAARPNFSGAYTLTGAKGGFKLNRAESWRLQVNQTESGIEVTKVIDGKRTKNQFLFNGSETVYLSQGGVEGTSKTQFKGKSLIIDTFVLTRPIPNGPAVQIHGKERWELSSDSKTLTIRNEVDAPSVPLGGFQVIEPWSEIYTRN
jgi:hypothetical protein